jgi:hypothetical protein
LAYRYLRFWKVFCQILVAVYRTFFSRELDQVGSMSEQVGCSLSGAKNAYLIFAVLAFLDTLIFAVLAFLDTL